MFNVDLLLQTPRTTAWRDFDTFSHITLLKFNWAFIPVLESVLGPSVAVTQIYPSVLIFGVSRSDRVY